MSNSYAEEHTMRSTAMRLLKSDRWRSNYFHYIIVYLLSFFFLITCIRQEISLPFIWLFFGVFLLQLLALATHFSSNWTIGHELLFNLQAGYFSNCQISCICNRYNGVRKRTMRCPTKIFSNIIRKHFIRASHDCIKTHLIWSGVEAIDLNRLLPWVWRLEIKFITIIVVAVTARSPCCMPNVPPIANVYYVYIIYLSIIFYSPYTTLRANQKT